MRKGGHSEMLETLNWVRPYQPIFGFPWSIYLKSCFLHVVFSSKILRPLQKLVEFLFFVFFFLSAAFLRSIPHARLGIGSLNFVTLFCKMTQNNEKNCVVFKKVVKIFYSLFLKLFKLFHITAPPKLRKYLQCSF